MPTKRHTCVPRPSPSAVNIDRYTPVFARTVTVRKPVGPLAFNCVKLMVIRAGSAIVFSEFGEIPVACGDAVLLSANTPCGSEPEGSVTGSSQMRV